MAYKSKYNGAQTDMAIEKALSFDDTLNGYPTNEELSAKLENTSSKIMNDVSKIYPTKTDVDKTLESYATTEEVNNALINYPTKEETSNVYASKEFVNSTLELYSKTDDINTELSKKQDKLIVGNGINIDSSNKISCTLNTTIFLVVSSLPIQPDSENINKIHLVLSETNENGNIYNEYIWANNSWEKLGEFKPDVDLTPYLKKTDAENIYSKKSDVENTYAKKVDVVGVYAEKVYVDKANSDFNNLLNRIYQTIGVYTDRPNIVLTKIEDNAAISKDGVKIQKSGWAIAEFTAIKGNEYLFKPGTMDSNVCIFAEKITKEETRAIDYIYTYDENGRIATAKTTYGGVSYSYTYSYVINDEGNIVLETITNDATGAVVSNLPYDYKTSIGSYQPMTILNADAELPKDGYCRLVSHFQNDTSITVVVSYNKTDADLTMLALRDGFTASICTQLGNLSKRIGNILDFSNSLSSLIEALRNETNNIIKTVNINNDFNSIPKLCGQPMVLYGNGVPKDGVVPDNWIQFIDGGYDWNGLPSALGQRYIDTSVSSGGIYESVRDGVFGLKWINC
ncbi:MAG: hypothetical protein ACI4N3_05375 [Alphaproteobacteria bacterium]